MRPGLYQVLDSLREIPALITGRRLDILASNRMARALHTDFDALPHREPNMARYVFLDPAVRKLYDDWSTAARTVVAILHVDAGRHPYDPQLAELIADLSLRDNDFRRFNPAAGATWTAKGGTNFFGGVSQGMRVPSPVELTCADPKAPCTLPNIFVADPPLKAIRATTYEAGVRGRFGTAGAYRVAAFRTDLADDIQFVSAGSGAVSSGFFQNVGRTRRQGLELMARVASGPFRFTAQYSLLDATFRTAFSEHSPANATADANGNIPVNPGDRIALSARQALRLRGEWTHGPFSLGLSALGIGSQYSRGNEDNADPAGRVPGHAVAALDASWQPARHWVFFARVDNLLDARYTTFAILGVNYFRGPGGAFSVAQAGAENFLSPASPRAAWLGIEYRFDGARP